MIREHRYIVAKIIDAQIALTETEFKRLCALSAKVDKFRVDNGVNSLVCLIVENDWPEYEPTWKLIEQRMDDKDE